MDYYDHDERERKQMHHNSSGPVRIYKAGPDGSGNMDGGNIWTTAAEATQQTTDKKKTKAKPPN